MDPVSTISEAERKDSIDRAVSRIILTADLFILCGLVVVTLYYLPRFTDLFKMMGGDLPALSCVVVSIHPLFYSVMIVVIAGALIANERLIDNVALRLRINIWAGFMLLVFSALLIHAMLQPFIVVMQLATPR